MRLPVLLLLLCSVSVVWGQSRSKVSYGVSLNPTLTFPINTSSSNAIIWGSQTYKQYADSVKSLDTYKLSMGASVWVNYMLNQKWTLQTGLAYSEVGFTRKQENIQLGDPLYPGIGQGILTELSNTTKAIDYSYKYQYVSVPVLFNYYAKRSGDFKWVYYFTGGIGFNVLVKDQMKAKLNDFVVDDETIFHLDSTGYEGSPFTVNLFLGGRIEYRVSKELQVFAQPMITAFPMSVSKTEIKSFPVGLQVNVGVAYALEAAKKDESRKD